MMTCQSNPTSEAPSLAPTPLIKVAIVDDDQEVREGLCFLIQQSPEMHCIATFGNGEDATTELQKHPADVVLMDIGLPGMSGVECLRQIKARHPQTQILMITVFEDDDRIFQSLKAGATGYLLKKEPPEKILESVKDLHAGGSPMSSQIARRVVHEFQSPQGADRAFASLTRREQQILEQLAKGYLYKEIAERLGISIETVRTHIRNIYEKLHVHSRTEAVNKVFPR